MTGRATPSKSLKFTGNDKARWLGQVLTDDNFSQKDFRIATMICEKTMFSEKRQKTLAKHAPVVVHRSLKKEGFRVTESHVGNVYSKLHRLGYLRGVKKSSTAHYYFMDTSK